jgi:hypothetical protein
LPSGRKLSVVFQGLKAMASMALATVSAPTAPGSRRPIVSTATGSGGDTRSDQATAVSSIGVDLASLNRWMQSSKRRSPAASRRPISEDRYSGSSAGGSGAGIVSGAGRSR